MGIITAGGLSTSPWGPATAAWAALVIRIRFSAVERAAVGLGFFLRLEAAGEGFVGGGVGLGVGVGVVGAEISCFFCWVGIIIAAGVAWWRRARGRHDAAFGKFPMGDALWVDEVAR